MDADCLKDPRDLVQDHILGCACTKHGAPKTPYELDLEVKDRKPAITPKVGDGVKIKSKEWYEKWKKRDGVVDVDYCFVDDMRKCCGKMMKVIKVNGDGFFVMGSVYTFSMEMFEEVYPKQEQLESLNLPETERDSPSQSLSSLPGSIGAICWRTPEERERHLQRVREKWGIKPGLEELTKRLISYTVVKSATPSSPAKLKMVRREKAIKLKKL